MNLEILLKPTIFRYYFKYKLTPPSKVSPLKKSYKSINFILKKKKKKKKKKKDPTLKENLYDEFLKYGKIISIRMEGEGERKVCIIFFRSPREAQCAVDSLNERPLFGSSPLKVERIDFSAFIQLVAAMNGNFSSSSSSSSFSSSSSTNGNSGSSSSSSSSSSHTTAVVTNGTASNSTMVAATTAPSATATTTTTTHNTGPTVSTAALNSFTSSVISNLSYEEELDEYCSRATRTLYIGNLERDVKNSDLRDKLDKKYGDIVEIEIKRDPKRMQVGGQFAFVQFADIRSVIKAMRCLNGKYIGGGSTQPVKLGFGRSLATNVLWLDGVSGQLKEKHLYEFFRRYCDAEAIKDILIDRNKSQALVYFAMVDDARICVDKIRYTYVKLVLDHKEKTKKFFFSLNCKNGKINFVIFFSGFAGEKKLATKNHKATT